MCMKRFLATLLLLTLVVAQPSKVAAGIKEGLAAYARGDYITALRELRPLAEQGDAAAQSELGVMYNNGQGVPRDDAKAFKWFSKAAEQGDDDGQYNLGVMYNNGQGVQQSYAEAIKWFRKAAEQGYVHGQYRLGVMYENGLGVTQDYVLAHMWHNLAAAKGYKDALKLRDIVAKSMTAAQIARAQHLAHEWTAEFEKKPAPSKPYEGNAPTAPTAAYAGNSDSDFRAIKLGDNFDPIINGYENNGKIPAAPGVRVDVRDVQTTLASNLRYFSQPGHVATGILCANVESHPCKLFVCGVYNVARSFRRKRMVATEHLNPDTATLFHVSDHVPESRRARVVC